MGKKKRKKKLMRRILMELAEITCLLRKIHRDMPRRYSGNLGPM